MDIAEIQVTGCGEIFIVSFVVRKKRSGPEKTEVTLHDILRSVDAWGERAVRFEAKVEAQMGQLNGRMDGLEATVDGLGKEMKAGFARVDGKIDAVDAKVDEVDRKVEKLDAKVERHYAELRGGTCDFGTARAPVWADNGLLVD